ncbi:MAG: LON peptidase substrate-binding domain-containing protein [Xanthomonadales bacterium]|nr:LON peptidase substrate-binding domain-containing protein [Xanthomonadales bacterium]
MVARDLPLFPLRTVLFPGGDLRLRVFEPRYLDLVRECSRQGSPFGVSLILEGVEAGGPALPAAVGTTARIVDFYTLPDGLLGLRCIGESRFRVRQTRMRDTGLIIGEIESLEAFKPEPVAPQHGLLAQLLERLLAHFGGPHGDAGKAELDDAHWVSFRLAEMLPFENEARQTLLALDSAEERLDRILDALPGFQSEG